MQKSIYSKQANLRKSQYFEYLTEHTKPTYNRRVDYFKSDEAGRLKST